MIEFCRRDGFDATNLKPNEIEEVLRRTTYLEETIIQGFYILSSLVSSLTGGEIEREMFEVRRRCHNTSQMLSED